MKKKAYYTTSDVAKITHVAVGSIINWVDDGKIKAVITPGGHRKISHSELIRFLKEHKYDIPKTLIDQRVVYVIDDEDEIHSLFSTIFKDIEGFELTNFSSGTEALIAMGRKNPDIIIVDILMPDIDGIEVIKHIKANKDYNNAYIVSMSGDRGNREKSINAGANEFLAKPFEAELVKTLISNID